MCNIYIIPSHTCMYVYICECVCMCVCMYIQKERERVILNSQSGPKFMAVVQQTDRIMYKLYETWLSTYFLELFKLFTKVLKMCDFKVNNVNKCF